MSRRLQDPIPAHITARQAEAANPAGSVWVAANAGSGKTHVLTERVLRLLLGGARPEAILCLTYTKAAAAVMRERVTQRLAHWAVASEPALAADLIAISGRAPMPAEIRRARTLFAHALETPGGLRINTIHAFCESVLHRFPFEARVPVDFAVIEDHQRADMVLAAREAILAGGLNGAPAIAEAVGTLFDLLSDSQLTEAIESALANGRKLRPVLADRGGAKQRLRAFIGFDGTTTAELDAALTGQSALQAEDCRTLITLLDGKPEGKRFVDFLARANPDLPSSEQLRAAFLTSDLQPRKNLMPKQEREQYPDLHARFERERDRIYGICQKRASAELIARSEALLDILGAISDRYENEKRARSLLDFDDLVDRLGDLFADETQADWVKYKLDAGIDHILVDEGQDTNPEQWRVVHEIADEFFVGDSAVTRPRTLFAVGDEKQSIYSFQGADPKLFLEMWRRFSRMATAIGEELPRVTLRASFRTLPGILAGVDKVFNQDLVRAAVLAEEAVIHETARAEPGGTVTLWPPIQEPTEPIETDAWPIEAPDAIKPAERQLAERIAGNIKNWLDNKRPLGPRGRPVQAGDILILVQARGALFREVIRALGYAGIPTPGADRLAVTGHIGVLDLLALGDVLVNPADDLQLAALLRSPLFEVSENDLFELAHDREASLWAALEISSIGSCKRAFEKLAGWRSRLDFERPFEFFAEVLYADGGLKRFHARLGGEVDDVFAEFLELALAHEQSEQPSLIGFLAAMRAREVTIKRELAETVSGVRVMTVHGAKGLEAPIVILADAASKPQGRQLSRPVMLTDIGTGPIIIHAGSKSQHVDASASIKLEYDDGQRQEYWRKLYVGMTRAEDELYVTGYLTPGQKRETQLADTWYAAVQSGLEPECVAETGADGEISALVYPAVRPALTPLRPDVAETPEPRRPLDLPPLPVVVTVSAISPSSAFEHIASAPLLETHLEAVGDAETARREGVALHALLQHLGKISPNQRPQVALKAAMALVPDLADRHAGLAREALAIMDDPEFAELFSVHSRAEVPFSANAFRNGAPVKIVGRIDRIVVASDRVLVIDYKSDANPPQVAADVPPGYLTQLGLYALVAGQLFPDLEIEAGILWTRLKSLMILPPPILENARSAFTME